MLKTNNPNSLVLPKDPGCLVIRETPCVFLRMETPRQRTALPYSMLLQIDLSEDETVCDLRFGSHHVRVGGRHLRHLYVSAAQAQAELIQTPAADVKWDDGSNFAIITEISVEPLEAGR